jgi:hypothetical protein
MQSICYLHIEWKFVFLYFFAGKWVTEKSCFVEGCGKINDDTKEKLGFLNTTCISFAANDEAGGGQNKDLRLDTINEALDSTG